MEHLLDESGLHKLVDLFADDPALFFVGPSKTLFHRLGGGTDIKGVLGDIPRNARHVRGTPRKYVSICAEKVDEHSFLFGVE